MNVAEILKDAPKGTVLWCDLFGEVTLEKVDKCRVYTITIRISDNVTRDLTETGAYYSNEFFNRECPCILWPSEHRRSWEGVSYKPKKIHRTPICSTYNPKYTPAGSDYDLDKAIEDSLNKKEITSEELERKLVIHALKGITGNLIDLINILKDEH